MLYVTRDGSRQRGGVSRPEGVEQLARQSLAVGGVHAPQLASCQHQDVFLLLMETQLLPSQAGFVQLSLR